MRARSATLQTSTQYIRSLALVPRGNLPSQQLVQSAKLLVEVAQPVCSGVSAVGVGLGLGVGLLDVDGLGEGVLLGDGEA